MPHQETARSKAKRDQIRRGAQQVFLTAGFAGATTDAIAQAAGVSKQTLYVYFRRKEELLVDVLTSLLAELHQDRPTLERADDVDSTSSLRAALVRITSDALTTISNQEYLALTRVIIADSPKVPEIGELWASTVTGTVRSVVIAQLEEARRAGLIDLDDVEVAARLLVGGVLTYVLPDGIVATDRPVAPPSTETLERMVDLFLRAIT
ncbi:TetR/AcrR family transcriptional regulator [Phytoactinopolyspora halotolerans]|uniref:TetR/AcrR family transcriptional regulator n=1 Tax=Phytoactinopolyspora halotolerans TaxID=1981512 RepID=A0A6L9SL21_9ACTN|nr:TetR/AcrR family transcriptional regulator [Phytoactinopolyspora halotolerans]NEE04740.1 TetR/AcrR family transcriptional regulator [Phytoactinopolyspora halotolerans]